MTRVLSIIDQYTRLKDFPSIISVFINRAKKANVLVLFFKR